MMLKLLPRYLTNREEKSPKQPLGPFLTNTTVYANPPASGLRITWFGHSTMLIEIDGVRVLTDPVWDERASPLRWIGPKRFYSSPLPLEKLPDLDAILISHDHYDHLGKWTVGTLSTLPAAAAALWIVPLSLGEILKNFGVTNHVITELDWTEATEVRSRRTGSSVRVTALPARHFSGRSLRNRFETLWASYAIRGLNHNLYYGGDSGYWEGFADIAKTYGPFDLSMLEVGAWDQNWESIHMGPDGAVRAFEAMGSHGSLMPIHWGLFDLALHGWRWPIQCVSDLADIRGVSLWSPAPGEPSEFNKGMELRSLWWQ